MERGSVRHGARIDDELAGAVEEVVRVGAGARREDLAPELPGPGEVGDDLHDGPVEDFGTIGMTADQTWERSELARWLRPGLFPATVDVLVDAARADGAPGDVLALLTGIAPTTRYESVGDVWRAAGMPVESRERADAPTVGPSGDTPTRDRTPVPRTERAVDEPVRSSTATATVGAGTPRGAGREPAAASGFAGGTDLLIDVVATASVIAVLPFRAVRALFRAFTGRST
jgi:hypothetical protein